MNNNLQKLIDSNDKVSTLGRAHQYQLDHPFKPKHSQNIVGGADNGIDQFAIIAEYHLKGFEYGNWVSNNDRYDHLIAANRSLKHLQQIIRSDNLGINGNVGIAFGGRGRGGGAMAHYEPRLNMINLTKPHGAGCLAHEYGHALDYNLGSYIDQHKTYSALSGGWSTAKTLEDNVGAQLRTMTNQLIDAIIQTDTHKALRENANEYWLRRTEIFARFFEQYICYKMRKISTDLYLTHFWDYYTRLAVRVYQTENEFMGMLPFADKLFAEIGKFLNGKGKLKTTPYPTEKRLKRVIKKAQKPTKPTPKPQEELKKAATPKTRTQKRNERIQQRYEAAKANYELEQRLKKEAEKGKKTPNIAPKTMYIVSPEVKNNVCRIELTQIIFSDHYYIEGKEQEYGVITVNSGEKISNAKFKPKHDSVSAYIGMYRNFYKKAHKRGDWDIWAFPLVGDIYGTAYFKTLDDASRYARNIEKHSKYKCEQCEYLISQALWNKVLGLTTERNK